MKKALARRCIPLMLALTMAVGLFTVCFGVAADTRDLKIKTFAAADLAAAAEEQGTVNDHDNPIFTTYQDTIGRVSTNPGNYLLHSLNIPFQDVPEGERNALITGDTIRLTVRLSADEIFMDGDLCQIEWLLGSGSYGSDYQTDWIVNYDDYEAETAQIDPTYGYEYKEFSLDILLVGDSWSEPDNAGEGKDAAQIRVKGLNEAPVTIYYIACDNVDTEQRLLECDGVAIGGRLGVPGYWDHVYPEGDQISGIVSYMGQHPTRNNDVEPFCYNAHGFDHKGNAANLMDSLGAELAAGDYAFGFKMKTLEAMGTTDKCLYSVWDGETKLQECVATQQMIKEAGGAGGGYCTVRVPFTVPESSAGHKITFQVELYDSNDYSLSQVYLYQVIDASTPVPEEAQAVIDAIGALDVGNAQGIAAARAAYNALSEINKAWVGDELADKLASFEKAQAEIAAVVDAITGLGDKAEVNETNYTEKKAALEAAEKLYANYVKANGQEKADQYITNAQALTEYRAAYDAAEAAAKEKLKDEAIKAVEALITAIGEVTEDNYADKEDDIVAAEEAMKQLEADYDAATAALVSNKADLEDARKKLDEFKQKPDVIYGDVNDDKKVDATDALWVLQHSVELRTLTETELKAADVTDLGKVDTKDALQILQKTVDLIDQFDVEKE